MSFNKTLIKYQKNKIHFHGEPNKIPHNQRYDFFIIIPAYSEYEYIDNTLFSINDQIDIDFNKLLVIVIINNSLSSSSEVKENNFNTYTKLIKRKYDFELIIIDSFSLEYAYDKKIAGVGLARKIGMDFCIPYSHKHSLYCSVDADTIIEKKYLDYISQIYHKFLFKAAVVNFSHQLTSNSIVNEAICEYELLLKQIAQQVHQSGSPYGYVSMGSTIICTVLAYISVGGMDPKQATEDFYFLQKLAKYDKIHQIDEILVHPSARQEQRVYLGTGYRLNNIANESLFSDLQFNQQAFQDLSFIYSTIKENWNCSLDDIQAVFIKYNEEIWAYFIHNSFDDIFYKIKKNTNNQKQFINQFNYWFDNLKIYKFLKMYAQI